MRSENDPKNSGREAVHIRELSRSGSDGENRSDLLNDKREDESDGGVVIAQF
jgi:hypothetical protein